MQMMLLADNILKGGLKAKSIAQRMKSRISAAIFTPALSPKGSKHVPKPSSTDVLVGYESSLLPTLCEIRDVTETPQGVVVGKIGGMESSTPLISSVDTVKPDKTSILPPNPDYEISSDRKPKLNMSLEATACLAASAPHLLPPLPSNFMDAIGQETCVWFNAFSGRVFRDASESAEFRSWMLRNMTEQLNKKNRPNFIGKSAMLLDIIMLFISIISLHT